MKASLGYKFVRKDMRSAHGDSGVWKVGEWKTWMGPLEMCNSGFHASLDPLAALDFANYGEHLCIVECRGQHQGNRDKSVWEEMRVIRVLDRDLVCRRFAIACARHVLPIFENKYPKDDRPRKAIEAAEAYLRGPTRDDKKNRAAARAAAWDAARDAAWAAWAAWDAARDAARDAAWAAWDAAWDAERKWQRKTLLSIIEESP